MTEGEVEALLFLKHALWLQGEREGGRQRGGRTRGMKLTVGSLLESGQHEHTL